MDDVAGAPSNGASEAPSVDAKVNELPNGGAQLENNAADSQPPAKSPREALERAFAKTDAPGKAEDAGEKRARDPATGQFATKEKDGAKPKEADAGAQKVGDAAKAAAEKAEKPASVTAPPARFAKAAQEAWAQTPEPVRAEVERAITEMTAGIEKYKADHEAFEPVRKFDEIAKQSGTTLAAAVENYYGIETLLKKDTVGGVLHICQNLGVDPRALAVSLAQAIAGQPRTVIQPQKNDSGEVAALKQKIAQLEDQIGGVGKDLKQREALSVVSKFAETHPYFDELSDQISQMLETKFAKDLSDAYEKAVRLNPEIAAKIEADKVKKDGKPDADQTRQKANKSITGAPALGSNPPQKPAGSAREALQNAFSQVGL